MLLFASARERLENTVLSGSHFFKDSQEDTVLTSSPTHLTMRPVQKTGRAWSGKQIKNHRERTISAVTSEWKLCGMSLVRGKKVVDFLYKLILT